MIEGDALHAAILAAPEDDTPRLVYADWLDETGQADPAEFIRVQVALARRPTLELQARERALLALHEDEWLAPYQMPGGPLRGGAHGQFRRGFIEIVWMTATDFRHRAEALFLGCPLRELRLTRTTELDLGKLMEYPLLSRLAGLDLSDRKLGDAAARLVVWSPFTLGLEVLRLRGCGISDDGAARLADGDWPLRELDVSFNPISTRGLDLLRARFGAALRADGLERRV